MQALSLTWQLMRVAANHFSRCLCKLGPQNVEAICSRQFALTVYVPSCS